MQGNIDFTGSLSGSIAGGGGGGSDVTITPTLTSGTKIADYEIDSEGGSLYAPTPEGLTAELPLSISDNTISIDLSDYITDTELNTILEDYPTYTYTESRYTPLATFNAYTISAESHFQKALTAGNNITINPVTNVISASAGISYSTAEQNTGIKWLDDKPVYQRICQFTMVNGGVNWQTVAHNIADIDTIIKFETIVESLGTVYPIPAIRNSSSFILIGMSTTDFLYINNWLATTDNPKVTAIVQYTKL